MCCTVGLGAGAFCFSGIGIVGKANMSNCKTETHARRCQKDVGSGELESMLTWLIMARDCRCCGWRVDYPWGRGRFTGPM